jgi:hypothetical protein
VRYLPVYWLGKARPLEPRRHAAEGDVDTAKSALRDYINATIGFEALAAPGPLN